PGAFNGLEKLRDLDLSQNKLEGISGDALNCLKNLRNLWLSTNQISKISDDVFANLTNLELLDLSNNLINDLILVIMNKKYVILWLMQVGACICLKCDHKEESGYNRRGLRHFIEAICYNVTSVASLEFELNATRIEKLTVLRSTVDTLPANSAISGLTHLRILTLKYLRTEKIAPGAFGGLNELEELDLSHNNLGELPVGIFNDLISLEKLDLSENQITKISSGLFANLKKLRELDLSVNLISDIDKSSLSDLVSLRALDLEQNNITVLHENLLLKTGTIDLSNNDITELDEISPNLVRLTLSHNNIRNLKSTKEKSTPESSGDYGLRNLDLSFNQIESASCFGFTHLTLLFLQNNQITVIKENSFSDCPNLARIDLSSNKIKSFENNAFKGLSKLQFLYVSSNNLEELNSGSFSGLANLEDLFFDNNRIVSFDIKEIVKNTPKLHSIRMGHNSFICEHLDTTLKSLRLCHVVPVDVN
ncbi:slit-like, partial [Asbolus verrucosus]